MLEVNYATQFKKDFKKVRKLPLPDLKSLFDIIFTLENEQPLHIKYKDHELTGDWSGFRECHIKPDWLLIYKIKNRQLILTRLGSHSELF
ncbi:MAG: type II toxin-antitoxin system YafQ family toxin [Algicola sp.]|nr:type II toxin-antitoxin system YafQ family toxin [Algicola sp.]